MHIKRSFQSEEELKGTLDYIYGKSKEGKCFNGILEAAFNEVTIITAIHKIKSNKGANTPGVDGQKMRKYLQMSKEKLIQLIQTSVKDYKPKHARRTFIKKSNGKLRPLGIPSAIDKIIQECIKIIIEPICEAKFYPQSFGFRPYRATKHALHEAIRLISIKSENKPVIAIEGDIEAYFDNINHRILLRKLYRIGVKDKRILSMIKEMLNAGYIQENKKYSTEVGSAQGSGLSPLLANVYLNDCDWMIGKMYHHPKLHHKNERDARTAMRRKGAIPKYLIRYADDWIIMTTMLEEAIRILNYLQKYYKHRLKLNLSKEKTIITDLRKKRVKFLGYEIEASPPRGSPGKQRRTRVVGKFYPDKEKAKKKVIEIGKEIRQLRWIKSDKHKAAQIEKINAIISGVAEYYKVSICSGTYKYIDKRVNTISYKTFRKLYGKKYKKYNVPLGKLSNRPQIHEGRLDKTYAIDYEGMWIGITKAYITHSQREKYPYNQNMTPYTPEGRALYQKNRKKNLPLNRPPIYDDTLLFCLKETNLNNFEYYMNREYAYNRDRGRCRMCREHLIKGSRHCLRINSSLAIEEINKVPNLIWLCTNCFDIIREGVVPNSTNPKIKSRILKYLNKTNSFS